MKKSISNKNTGIAWVDGKCLEDLHFVADVALLSNTPKSYKDRQTDNLAKSQLFTCFIFVSSFSLNKHIGLQGLPGLPGKDGSPGPKGDRGAEGPKGDCGGTECELLKTEISDLQEQLKTLKATVSQIQKAWIFQNGNSASEKTFVANGAEGDFETSKATCSQAGGLIASPRNSAENSAIQQIVVRHNKVAYIGINDIQTEGSFKYLSGEAIEYSNWAAREPNNVGGIEDCVEVYSDGRWNDKSCNEKRLIICEF
ncbi:pulmonary surfactant-associated protein D-like [Chelonoidis abingdonii]|uniref:pulmonary surfactant-associated protein D-like n=1 Tax=Chelonoidis abingdonii TaxID=106734 RepID=UPI0013F18AF3|nr:pulmonary surfactant-associated protein D-like [Chelonoidis abingdonii]